jgi:hypothetical protein
MQLPNFIIAGAPKSGTTALYEYLQTHPQVFLTEPKEPLFYADDLGAHREIVTRTEYLNLYNMVPPEKQAIGEASVWYMHSSVAMARVKEEIPNARLVLMLRHPIDLIRSLHSDLLWICFETEQNLEKAWDLQDERRAGRGIPRLCQVPWFLDYRYIGQLGQHMTRLLKLFPLEQTKIFLFDDLKESPKRVYEEVLSFLGLPSDGRNEFPKVNAGKRNRLSWLARWQATVVRSLPRTWIQAGKRFGLGHLNRSVTRINSQPSTAVPLRPEFRQQLLTEFRDDINLLGDVIHRDLSHWQA